MNTRARRKFALLFIALFIAFSARAEGPYRNRDNRDPNDDGEGTYPIPYQLPTVAEITELLQRIHGYLDRNTPP